MKKAAKYRDPVHPGVVLKADLPDPRQRTGCGNRARFLWGGMPIIRARTIQIYRSPKYSKSAMETTNTHWRNGVGSSEGDCSGGIDLKPCLFFILNDSFMPIQK